MAVHTYADKQLEYVGKLVSDVTMLLDFFSKIDADIVEWNDLNYTSATDGVGITDLVLSNTSNGGSFQYLTAQNLQQAITVLSTWRAAQTAQDKMRLQKLRR